MSQTAKSTARLNMRLPAELKTVIEAAAAHLGQSVSDYAVSTLVQSAQNVLHQHSVTVLSKRDRDIFVALLDDADAKPLHPALAAQQIGGAATVLAKGAIPADDDMRGADRADDDFGDEILGAFCRKAEIEMLHKEQFDAQLCQFPLFDAKRREPVGFGC